MAINLRHRIVSKWQQAPLSWRRGLVNSKFATPLRWLANRLYGLESKVFGLAAPLDGCRMRLDWHSSKAFVFGTYEPAVVQLLLEIVRPDWLVLDVGAHVGYFALLLAKLVGPSGKVIAFEPCPANFQCLAENVRINNLKNVVLEHLAVTATSGTTTLRSNDDDQLSFTASLADGQPMIEVKTMSLDDYASRFQERVNFIMMDVEGFEEAVLQGAESTVRRFLPIFLIELHGFDQLGSNHPAIKQLRRMGYEIRFLNDAGAQVHVLAEHRQVSHGRF